MNILSVGNSFSEDAQRYLHDIAKADGVRINCFNLYIGGCPLSLHYRNMLSGEKAYSLEMNGESTGFKVSLKEALLSHDWDVITLQQVSSQSPDYETYKPYISEIAEYVRKMSPKAKIAVHETWSYEENSIRLNEELGYAHHGDMYRDIKNAYKKAAEEIKADFIIPSGALFEMLISEGLERVHRDTYHATYGGGRYALGLLWYAFLTGNSVNENSYGIFDEEISSEEIDIIKRSVGKILEKT